MFFNLLISWKANNLPQIFCSEKSAQLLFGKFILNPINEPFHKTPKELSFFQVENYFMECFISIFPSWLLNAVCQLTCLKARNSHKNQEQNWPGVMTGLGGSVGDALQLHQDLTEGSARHLLHLDVESLASPVSRKEKFMLTLENKERSSLYTCRIFVLSSTGWPQWEVMRESTWGNDISMNIMLML